MNSISRDRFTITVIGTGFVGVVTSAILAKFKHNVFGLDIDPVKISQLSQGQVPFFEPNLRELLTAGLSEKNLSFTTNYQDAIPHSDIIFIAVGTPSAKDGTADLSAVKASAKSIAPHLKDHTIVCLKSTVPPGTNDIIRKTISQETNKRFAIASVPEFLKEGSAVADTLKPDRIVIGAREQWAIDKLIKLHSPLKANVIVTNPESAQMAKYTANAYLAQRITFINQIANLCEKNKADINQVIDIIGADKRIGDHYWYPGLGYGGSCFPKDVKELAAYAKKIGEGEGLLVKIDELNRQRITNKLNQFGKAVGGYKDKTIAILGLSFKPHTNDLREAPSTKIIPYLKKHKAIIKAYDPEAVSQAQTHFPPMFYASDVYEAIEQVDVIFHLIEWPELINIDLAKVASKVNDDCWFIDTRNQFDPEKVKSHGLNYIGIGVGS